MQIIKMDNLEKSFRVKAKKIQVLKGLSLEVSQGEILGFLGPNGAGKSTTIKIIMSLIRADSGGILVFGEDSKSIEVRRKIGFLPENPSFIDSLTGMDLLMLSASMYKIPQKIAKERASELLQMVELEEAANRSIRKYSKGMIQRIGFASAMIHEPELLILDEPMSGLDPMGRYTFKKMMKEINAKGTTIFFSSHIIPDMEDICDRVAVMKSGELVKVFDRNEIKYAATTGYRVIIKASNVTDSFKFNFSIERLDGEFFAIAVSKDNLVDSLLELKKVNVDVVNVEPIKKNLEELFVEMIK